jgi:F-type H+-transporting ATPase subunit gamma
MPSLKDIKIRIKSVKTTQQATKAMKLMAATKLRKAQDVLMRMRPYAAKLGDLQGRLIASLEGSDFTSEYSAERPVNNVLVVVVTSNRGLAGAFNTNICKEAQALIDGKYAEYKANGHLQLLCVGKKGFEFFSKRKYPVYEGKQFDLFSKLNYDDIEAVAGIVMNGYLAGKWDRVELVYNEFKNMLTQNKRAEQFLPVAVPTADTKQKVREYIYEPQREEIITALVPKILKVKFYRAILESNLSEQAARMLAMDNATENAQDLIDALQLSYNKARQAAITKEIIEIVSGANALAG